MTNEDRATAYHEAAHAVFAWRHGKWLRKDGVSINPGTGTGLCHTRNEAIFFIPGLDPRLRRQQQMDAEAAILGLIAGDLAEVLMDGNDPEDWRENCSFAWYGPLSDQPTDGELALLIYDTHFQGDFEDDLEDIFVQKCVRILKDEQIWAAIEAVAESLLQEGTLSNEDVDAVVVAINPPVPRWCWFSHRHRPRRVTEDE